MNRRLKVFILVLLTAVMCLSAGIASLYRGSEEPVPAESSAAEPEEKTAAPPILFPGPNGLWGARSATGRTLIEPTWYYLKVMSQKVLIARRSTGKVDSFGLIRTTGEQIVPFLYSNFDQREPDVWIATLQEDGKERYHIYHADGTLWMEQTWDSAELEDGMLTVTQGKNRFVYLLTERGVLRQSFYAEYPVGLHRLLLAPDEETLAALPEDSILLHLGKAAADFLITLFVTHTEPDVTALGAEESSATGLRTIGRRYTACTLQSAEIKEIRLIKNGGYPTYRIRMQLKYTIANETDTEVVGTSAWLTVSRNADGAYIYSKFSDARMDAQYGV